MKQIFDDIRKEIDIHSDEACFMPDDMMVVSESWLKQILDEAEAKCETECGSCVNVIDRIVERIEEEANHAYADFDDYAEEYGLDAEYNDDFRNGMQRAIRIIHEESSQSGWIPVEKELPPTGMRVQVTYKGKVTGKPFCDAMAYVDMDGKWHWDGVEGKESCAATEIIAWKSPGEPYQKGE